MLPLVKGGIDVAFLFFSLSRCCCWGGVLGQRPQRGAHTFLNRARLRSGGSDVRDALFPLGCWKTRDLAAASAARNAVTLLYSIYAVHAASCVY